MPAPVDRLRRLAAGRTFVVMAMLATGVLSAEGSSLVSRAGDSGEALRVALPRPRPLTLRWAAVVEERRPGEFVVYRADPTGIVVEVGRLQARRGGRYTLVDRRAPATHVVYALHYVATSGETYVLRTRDVEVVTLLPSRDARAPAPVPGLAIEEALALLDPVWSDHGRPSGTALAALGMAPLPADPPPRSFA